MKILPERFTDERGIALILVLWVTVLLTIIASSFVFAVRTESQGLANDIKHTEAYYIARSGMSLAVARLLSDISKSGDSAAEESGRWIYDGRPYRVELSKGYAEIRIYDEGGKVDLNAARREDLVRVLKGLGVEGSLRDVIADSILDWRDDNNFHRLNGAEDDFYRKLTPGYEAKDGPFDTVDELLWVRGVTKELFYGHSEDDQGRVVGLRDVFTVFTGSYRINVNTAPYELLLTVPGMDERAAANFIEARKYGGVKDMRDYTSLGARSVPGTSSIITFAPSDTYTVESTGILNGDPAVHTIRAVVRVDGPDRYSVLYYKDVDGMNGRIS